MNTPSHLIINAALRKRATSAGLTIPRGPFQLGAVLPDIPLTLLWIGAYVWYRSIQGDPNITLMDETFDRLYFTHPPLCAETHMSPGFVLVRRHFHTIS